MKYISIELTEREFHEFMGSVAIQEYMPQPDGSVMRQVSRKVLEAGKKQMTQKEIKRLDHAMRTLAKRLSNKENANVNLLSIGIDGIVNDLRNDFNIPGK